MDKQLKILLIIAVALFVFSGILILIGSLFKLQHWYFAGPLLIIGISVNALSYVIGGIALIQYLRKQ